MYFDTDYFKKNNKCNKQKMGKHLKKGKIKKGDTEENMSGRGIDLGTYQQAGASLCRPSAAEFPLAGT